MPSNVKYKPVPTSEGEEVDGGMKEELRTKSDAKWQAVWRSINLVMVVFFCLAAYVQINDPDPYIWIPAYLLPAVTSVAVVFKPEVQGNVIWRAVCVVLLGLHVGGAVYLCVMLTELMMRKVTNPLEYEEGRELAGVLITLVWLSIIRFSSLGGGVGLSSSVLLAVCSILGAMPVVLWGFCFIEYFHQRMSHCHYLCSAKF